MGSTLDRIRLSGLGEPGVTHLKKVPQHDSFLESCNHSKMDQPAEARSWVQKLQHRQWGFEEPRPELLKIQIDLHPKDYQPTSTHLQQGLAQASPPCFRITNSLRQVILVVQSPLRLSLLILGSICRTEGNNPAGLMSQVFCTFAPRPISFHEVLIVKSAKRESATRLVPGQELSSIWKRISRRSQGRNLDCTRHLIQDSIAVQQSRVLELLIEPSWRLLHR